MLLQAERMDRGVGEYDSYVCAYCDIGYGNLTKAFSETDKIERNSSCSQWRRSVSRRLLAGRHRWPS